MLIIMSGLPGAGKTTLSRELARRLGAVHIRIDTIEQTLRGGGFEGEMTDAGYRIGYAIAEDNLRLGRTVIADSVNPIALTRNAWRDVATRAGVRSIDVEIVCSDPTEHRRRVETRAADIAGHKQPTWNEVMARKYELWTADRIVVDTTRTNALQAAGQIASALT